MEELLKKVKQDLGITIDDMEINANLRTKINAVKLYLKNGGAKIPEDNVPENVVSCISIGVNDLLNNRAGETKFSPAFILLATQICSGGV